MGRMSKKLGQRSHIIRPEMIIVDFFYEEPARQITVRQLAAQIKLSRSTVQYYLRRLKEQGVISEDNKWIDSEYNRLRKIFYYTEKIAASGLVDFLENELAASAVILFGSFSKGDSVRISDIDLFVECARDRELNLTPFEQSLGHHIELFTKRKITQLPDRLLNSVINGIKIRGYFTIK